MFKIECDGHPVNEVFQDEESERNKEEERYNPTSKIFEVNELGSDIVEALQEEADNQERANIPWIDPKYPL